MIDHDDIFRTGIALLAFVVAFYAVIAREQKTPYILNSIYSITFIVLIALLLSLASNVVEPDQSAITVSTMVGTNMPSPAMAQATTGRTTVSKSLNITAAAFLGFGIVFIAYRLWRIMNRQVNFRDDQLHFTIPFFLKIRRSRQRARRQKEYEHNPAKFSQELLASLKGSDVLPPEKFEKALKHNGDEQEFSTSASFLVPTHMEADHIMADLAVRFLDNECFVQYTTCSRHPVEFLHYLKRAWLSKHQGGDWNKVKDFVVVVDGYTPHFGFTDTIYSEWSRATLEDCYDCIVSPATYAGVHTAIANAFNKAKKKSGKPKLRAPALVMYEGAHALVDLESSEQYRIFIRHVVPSERLWGGMFTLFIESSVSTENLSVLKEVTHIFVDKTGSGNNGNGQPH